MSIGVSGGGGAGSGVTDASIVSNIGGTVQAGESGVVYMTEVKSNEKLVIERAALLDGGGAAVPNNLDLIIIRLDNTGGGEKIKDILTGDGSAIYDDEVGNPITDYENTGSNDESIAVVVDNGNFNNGTGASQNVNVGIIGEVTDVQQ